jgi:hypothetical protein
MQRGNKGGGWCGERQEWKDKMDMEEGARRNPGGRQRRSVEE